MSTFGADDQELGSSVPMPLPIQSVHEGTKLGSEVTRRPTGGLHVTPTGPLTIKDLKKGLLLLVREDGWQEPVLWDFRQVTEFQIAYADLIETVRFIEQFLSHFPPRGRVALLVASPQGRALAMSYRELHMRHNRRQICVVESTSDADKWLDGGARQGLQSRAMRFTMQDASGSLDGVGTEIVNVSHSGALLVVPTAPPLEAEHHLVLTVRPVTVDVRVRVVRAHPHLADTALSYWLVAVEFLAPAEAIAQLRELALVRTT